MDSGSDREVTLVIQGVHVGVLLTVGHYSTADTASLSMYMLFGRGAALYCLLPHVAGLPQSECAGKAAAYRSSAPASDTSDTKWGGEW